MKRYKRLFETKINSNILKDMRYFGLDSSNIDSNGYVTLYHGGIKLPTKLKKGEIFFMTPDIEEAENYAKMRKGKVFKLKVNPEDVHWNQGSREVEFDKGGLIKNNIILPLVKKKNNIINKKNKIEYKGYKIGDILPKAKHKILDIVIFPDGKAQFKFKNFWYDADMAINYEKI